MSLVRVEIYHGCAVIEDENGTTRDVVVRLWDRESPVSGQRFVTRNVGTEGEILTPMSEVNLNQAAPQTLYLRCQNVRRKMTCQRWSSRFVVGEPEAIMI